RHLFGGRQRGASSSDRISREAEPRQGRAIWEGIPGGISASPGSARSLARSLSEYSLLPAEEVQVRHTVPGKNRRDRDRGRNALAPKARILEAKAGLLMHSIPLHLTR